MLQRLEIIWNFLFKSPALFPPPPKLFLIITTPSPSLLRRGIWYYILMTTLNNLNRLKTTRKQLRNNCTEAESIFWKHLQWSQLLGLKFRRQHSVWRYILDFYCPKIRLWIELDWEIHTDRKEYDSIRTKFLEAWGYSIIRFSNDEIGNHIDITLERLQKYITQNYDIS